MISQNIQTLRTREGMTQEGRAERLGVSRQAVAKWESDESMPDLDNASAIAALKTFNRAVGASAPDDQDRQERPCKRNSSRWIWKTAPPEMPSRKDSSR